MLFHNFDNDNQSSYISNNIIPFDFNNSGYNIKDEELEQDAFISQSIFNNPEENLRENISRSKPTSFITQDLKKNCNNNTLFKYLFKYSFELGRHKIINI